VQAPLGIRDGRAGRQLRGATPFRAGPDVLVRDRDDKYTAVFDRVAKGAGIRVVRTVVRAPLMKDDVSHYTSFVRFVVMLRGRLRSESFRPCCFIGESAPAFA